MDTKIINTNQITEGKLSRIARILLPTQYSVPLCNKIQETGEFVFIRGVDKGKMKLWQ